MSNDEDNQEAGYDFERYVTDLFPKQRFQFKKNPIRFEDALDIDQEENEKPDLYIELKGTGYRFWVECKFRRRYTKSNGYNNLNWCTKEQYNRYMGFYLDNNEDVFVAIGVGGQPDKPSKFYFAHIRDLPGPILYETKYPEFEREPDRIFKVEYRIY